MGYSLIARLQGERNLPIPRNCPIVSDVFYRKDNHHLFQLRNSYNVQVPLGFAKARLHCSALPSPMLIRHSNGELSVQGPSNMPRAILAVPGRRNCSGLRGTQIGDTNCPILRHSLRTCRYSLILIVYLRHYAGFHRGPGGYLSS